MRNKSTICIIIVILNSFYLCTAQETSSKRWSLSDCLQYGLENHPLIKISNTGVDSEKAKLRQTRAYWDPKLDFRSAWSHRKIDSGGALDNVIDSTSESIAVSKILLDSGQNRYDTLAARKSIKSAQAQLENTRLEIAAEIKKAYFAAQQAKALVKVREEALDGYEKHLEKVKGFVEVGTRPPYDITRARVDVANARVDLISAKSRLKVAKTSLARSIGLERDIEIDDFAISDLRLINMAKDQMREEAFSRPELQSADYDIESAEARIKSLRSSLRPYLAASADYSWSGTTTPLNRQWTAGVSLNWSLFDGDLTRSRVAVAKSQLAGAKESMRNLRLSVNSELENAFTKYEDAVERFKATEILVQQASESMNLAEGRYDAGLGNPIEINDARVEYVSARGNYVVAFFDILIAAAELDRVIGRLPEEYRIQSIEPASITMEIKK